LLAAGAVSSFSAAAADVYASGKRHAGDIPNTIGILLVVGLVVMLLHRLAARLASARRTRFVPYSLLFCFAVSRGLVNRTYLYAAVVPGSSRFCYGSCVPKATGLTALKRELK